MTPQKKKQKATKRQPAALALVTDQEKFITLGSRRLYKDQLDYRNIVEGYVIQDVTHILWHIVLLTNYGFDKFFSIKEGVYQEAIRLFYANMTVPDVPDGTDPIIQSNLLRSHI